MFYNVIDDDKGGPLDEFTEADFEKWLSVGLKQYLFEGRGVGAFPQIAGTLARADYLSDGIRNAYRDLSPEAQSRLRSAVAKVLASLEADSDNVLLFEHLLSIAAALQCGEVLRVLPTRVGHGFFGIAKNSAAEGLFGLTVITVTKLAAPRDETMECLNALLGSRHFDHAYAGLMLTAMCQADSHRFLAHMERMREPLAAMFQEFNTSLSAKRALARQLLDSIDLATLVDALPHFRYIHPDPRAVLDDWFVCGIMREHDAPLHCEESAETLYFYRSVIPTVKMQFNWDADGALDFYQFLKDQRLICDTYASMEREFPDWNRRVNAALQTMGDMFNVLKPKPA